MRVTGRNDDMLIIRGVNVYPSQVEAVLVNLPDLAAALSDRADARGHA
jgi:phenylacetate-CoA ligase